MTTSLLPQRLRLTTTLLLATSLSPLALADSLPISQPVTVTLDSGVKVLLKPDHSWEYLLDTSTDQNTTEQNTTAGRGAVNDSAASASSAGSAIIPTSSAIPVTASNPASLDSASKEVSKKHTESSDAQTRLNDSALANPQLLSEGHRDGVVARLTQVSRDGDEAVLHFAIHNTAGQSVIGVKAKLRLYADDGHLLATREVSLWVGEYRLPQTYLRPDQTRDSREVRVELPEGEWSRQLVRVEVTEVEFR